MANSIHSGLTAGSGIHVVQSYEYADDTARLAATGFLAADVGKIAQETDTGTYWILVNDSPAEWREVTNSTAELTTASNVGTAGEGLFKQLAINNLEFKNIAGGSAKVTVTDNLVTDSLDIDVVEGQVNHNTLLNYSLSEHRVINDGGGTTTDLWSADKITGELGSVADQIVVINNSISMNADNIDTNADNIILNADNIILNAGNIGTNADDIVVLNGQIVVITDDIVTVNDELTAVKADIQQVIFVTSTIQAAINSASDGNVVLIPAGIYDEAVTINKRITLQGQGADTIIRNTGTEDGINFTADGTGLDSANKTVIRDLVVDGSGFVGSSGISTVALVHDVDIINVNIIDCDLYGLEFNTSGVCKNIYLSRLRFERCDIGIKNGGGTTVENLTLEHSQILDNDIANNMGIFSTAGLINWTIRGCDISGQGLHGAYFGQVDGLLIEETTFFYNGAVITSADESSGIKFSAHTNQDVKNGIIRNCRFERNGEGTSAFTGDDIGNGIVFVGSGTPCLVQNWLIENCVFENNRHTGVRAYGKSGAVVDNITIRNTRFLNNGNVNGAFGAYTIFSAVPAATIDADECYWGADDGPGGAGSGNGNSVSLQVSFVNWLTRYNIPAEDVVNNSTASGATVKDALDGLDTLAHSHTNQAELDLVSDGDHDVRSDNPHTVTKAQVGLSAVPNLDTTAAVSASHSHTNQAELDLVSDGDHDVRLDNPHTVTKTQVGLSNVDNVQQIPATAKGTINGVATLDGTVKHTNAEIPDFVKNKVEYKGAWNATANTPTLSASGGGGVQGDYYTISVAGSTAIDSENDWRVGDFIINNGTVWEKTNNFKPLDPAHGEMYENTPAGTAIALTTGGTFYGWVSAVVGEVESGVIAFTGNATADRLTVTNSGGGAGVYKVDLSVSFSGSINEVITGAVHLNGVPVNKLYFARKLNINGDIGAAGLSGKIVLVEDDYLDMRFTAVGNTKSISMHYVNLSIQRVA